MAFTMLLSFAACGKEEPIVTPDNTSPEATETTTEAPKFDETVVTDGKTNKLTIRTPFGEFVLNESNTGVTYLVAKTSTGNAMYVMVWSCTVEDATPIIETITIN